MKEQNIRKTRSFRRTIKHTLRYKHLYTIYTFIHIYINTHVYFLYAYIHTDRQIERKRKSTNVARMKRKGGMYVDVRVSVSVRMHISSNTLLLRDEIVVKVTPSCYYYHRYHYYFYYNPPYPIAIL